MALNQRKLLASNRFFAYNLARECDRRCRVESSPEGGVMAPGSKNPE
jgi:hypothetical protein